MKKISVLLMAVFVLCGILSGCGSQEADKKGENEKKIKIVTTSFAAYDWTRELIGAGAKHIDLTLLNAKGIDMHSYKPTVEDVAKISACDLFIYVGGESEDWVKGALAEAKNKNLQSISLLDTLGKDAKEEKIVEGMQTEKEASHDKDDEHKHHEMDDEHDKDEHKHSDKAEHEHNGKAEHKHHDEAEYDEHVWLSLRNAELYVKAIEQKLCLLDAEYKDEYAKNAASYIGKLKESERQFTEKLATAKQKAVLFGDRFPFRYLLDDYGIKYYAAFAGCSAETEASFETIVFLSKKVDELGIKTILKIEGSPDKIAKTIRDNSKSKNQEILEMNSMQSVNLQTAGKDVTYIKIMETNLKNLATALQ